MAPLSALLFFFSVCGHDGNSRTCFDWSDLYAAERTRKFALLALAWQLKDAKPRDAPHISDLLT